MKYEYKVIDTRNKVVPGWELSGIQQRRFQCGLDDLGSEGWRMCGILSHMIIFIRDKDDNCDQMEE